MLTLKFRTKYVPTSFIARKGVNTSGRKADGTIEYEINPDVIGDIIDELCEKIIEVQKEAYDYWKELQQYRPQPEPKDYTSQVQVSKGYGD